MAWTGNVWLGMGALAFWGEVGETAPHTHAAHQVFLGAGPASTVRAHLPDRTLGPARRIVIPSGTPHQTSPAEPSVRGLVVWLEPDRWPHVDDALIDGWPGADSPMIDEAGAARIAAWVGDSRHRDPHVHDYVRRALAVTSATLTESPTLRAVSAEIGVSSSHLSRLWRQDLGMSFNTWLRWARLREAARLVGEGASITDAAHGAGFADGAHASRVCRSMFGLSPLELTSGLTLI
ncbi:MAG: AraC family transcriptional regulator [Gordonia sp. (in: high G+C Gram-positive bacteria)]|uniref:helix-turn-helix transcriptional regulator n=1 Tax=Gordonia sp. (in: high G+C Gram-positive bacteria) TaxID=84139 RepID=UPI0039E3A53E